MKVGIVGAGPSGLYLAILLARSNPRHEITVYERNAPDATFGWGVVFSEDTLGTLRDADGETYLQITDTFARWDAVDISYRGQVVRCRGHAFSAIARKQLLGILQRRAAGLGVKLSFGSEVRDVRELDVDLLVGADGVRSIVRAADPESFRPRIEPQGCKYVWFGTDLVFDAFRFIFAESEHGLFQVHAYPFDENTSTFIVECREETWRSAGLDSMSEPESIEFCQRLFADELGQHRLMSNKSDWLDFPLVRNRSWHTTLDGTPAVLLGDAAHTAHFTIGSGTKLAMEDAVSLANAFARGDVPSALVQYEQERQPVVERFQEAAADSADYFTRVRHHTHLEPPQFAFNLLTRSGRISHAGLTLRDPRFVGGVDGWFAGRTLAPPPAFTPLRLGGLQLTNRVVSVMAGSNRPEHARPTGAGLVLTDLVAVTADGRVTPETPVLPADAPWLRAAVESVHATGAAAGVLLGHAGRRGSTRPPARGVDVPLPAEESWPLLAASALAYAPFGQTPQEAGEDDLARVLQAFVAAARAAAETGVDLLELDCGHGRLLAGFLSPLSNERADGYGGDNRLRYPLEVLAAVRAAWPAERSLSVRLTVTDWARGGSTVDDGVAAARAMADAGADLVHVVAGQTVAGTKPEYRRGFLTAISDRVRSEARVPTLVGGHLTTVDAVNTVLAAGRADLCLATFPDADLGAV